MPEAEEPRSCVSLKRHHILLWRPLALPASSPFWAVRLTSLAGGHPSSAAHIWQQGGTGGSETSLELGLQPGQLAAPSARLPPGLFEQLEHPTGLQSG